ncbi:ABC-F family ATP-binding cassette domain-containing protein [Opitutales bacterium]|nr:ABC-F family ATP-binding cassette domain-containing protein [Opitutales bacterium]
MLTLSNLSKRYGPKILFREVSLRMMRGEKMGLVGANGAGKTTLFSILLGEIDEDEGKIEWEKGNRIGYLPQESAPTGEETVLELATATTNELAQALKILREDNDPASPQRLEAQEIFAEQEGYNLEAKAKKILSGLAFHQDDFNKPAHTLSGGWIMRAHLARLLVMEPDLLMLDEPTNHLDLETLGWFQAQVQKFSGSVLTISHDRAFLNSICNGILEISNRKLHRYPGNFDNYLIQKKEREAQHLAAYRNQQREIAHHEDFIRRFRAKASKASQAQARIKTLEKMERIDPPEESDATINFTFPQPPRSGQRVATLNAVRQAYGDHLVYSNLNLEVEKHERIALVGPNGAGKSTLLKILSNIVPIDKGSRELGHNVSVGYFSQQRVEVLDMERSVIDEATENTDSSVHEQDARTLLGAFLFRGDDVFKKVKVLSGGEKSRLALVKLLLSPPNFLLLDEPTTHLDMASIDAVIQALRDYTGTLIFVSHDIHFIRALGKRTIRIESGKITDYAGNYDYYLWKSGSASAQTGLIEGLRDARPEQTSHAKNGEKALSAKEKRRQRSQEREKKKAERRKLEDKVRKLEKEIMQLEEEQGICNEGLANPDSYNDKDKAKELNNQASRLARNLQQKNYEWEIETEKLLQVVESEN